MLCQILIPLILCKMVQNDILIFSPLPLPTTAWLLITKFPTENPDDTLQQLFGLNCFAHPLQFGRYNISKLDFWLNLADFLTKLLWSLNISSKISCQSLSFFRVERVCMVSPHPTLKTWLT